MQIRIQTYRDKAGQVRQGKTIALLRYAYNPEKKRSKQVMIGTVDRWANELPSELATQLDDDEKQEFHEWVVYRDEQIAKLTQCHHLLRVVEHLALAAKALQSGVEPFSPERIWDAIEVFGKALENAGHPKPIKGRGRPAKEAVVNSDDLLSSPYDDPVLQAESTEGWARMAALPNFIPDDSLVLEVPNKKKRK